jgi:hypothetical protein
MGRRCGQVGCADFPSKLPWAFFCNRTQSVITKYAGVVPGFFVCMKKDYSSLSSPPRPSSLFDKMPFEPEASKKMASSWREKLECLAVAPR